MFKLNCPVQKYKWGKTGTSSKVSEFIPASEVSSTENYAELWMGTHPNGPAVLAQTGEKLADFIKNNKDALGEHEQGELQFLFKVLSVGTALSVQSHPTNEQAQILHFKDPKNYPDPRHKPEMAIALTTFELLCGFREPLEILANIKNYHEVIELIDENWLVDIAHSSDRNVAKESLQKIFSKIWKSDQSKISETVKNVIERISKHSEKTELDHLLIRLDKQYPGGDVGVLAPLFLNHFYLKEGESTFLGPNEPHAYLSGDCIECMACSDNTIRAGLTPKFKDVETLCSSLTYNMSPPPYFHAKEAGEGTLLYAPPVPEFAVQKITKTAKSLNSVEAASIIVVVQGEATFKKDDSDAGEKITKGEVLFIPVSTKQVLLEASPDFHGFRAFTPKN